MAHTDIERQAHEACENERIRTPDSIQPHGCLCVCDLQFKNVTHISQNAQSYFGKPAKDILGKPLETAFHRAFCHALRNAAGLRTITVQREYLGVFDFGSGKLQVACHQRGDHFIMEFCKANEREDLELDINRLRWLQSQRSLETKTLRDALDILVHDMRTFTKFSRVMAIRFHPDGSGEVMSESTAPNMDSLLGLRFHKADIPESARTMNLELPLRFISDVNTIEVPLLHSDENVGKIDMALSELRGVTPDQKTCLCNLGLRSSIDIPIVFEGKLWGMFWLQDGEPQRLTIKETLAIELVGQMHANHISKVIRKHLKSDIEGFKKFVPMIFSYAQRSSTALIAVDGWKYAAREICSSLNLNGMYFEIGEELFEYGKCPKGNPRFLKEKLEPSMEEGILTTDELNEGSVAGAICVEISSADHCYLWLFRKPEDYEISWTGVQKEPHSTNSDQLKLQSQSSLLSHVKEVKGKSRPWEPGELKIIGALKKAIRSEYARKMLLRQSECNDGETEKSLEEHYHSGMIQDDYNPLLKTILILEDDQLIGDNLLEMIRTLGEVNVLLVTDNLSAQRKVKEKVIDYAFIDLDLKGENCKATASLFHTLGIKFSFITEQDAVDEWVNDFDQSLVVKKPVMNDVLSSIVTPIIVRRVIERPLTFLILEDNLPLQEQLSQEIQNLGHRVERAGNVLEAEAVLDHVDIDAIILDLFIEGNDEFPHDGTLRIVSRIRNEINNRYKVEKDVPVLAISGGLEIQGGFSPLKTAKQIGVDECMAKPLNLDQFRTWVMAVKVS